MLKGLVITPPVLGRISIGKVVEKAGKRLPEKDDQFTITSQVQGADGWLPHPFDEGFRKAQGGKMRSIPIRLLFNDPDLISTNNSTDALLVTFTGAPVMAVAGNFWPTAFGFPTLTGDMILTLSDGTVETFPSNSPTVFRGIVTCAPITSIRIDTPDNTPTVVLRWPTLDNLIIGQ